MDSKILFHKIVFMYSHLPMLTHILLYLPTFVKICLNLTIFVHLCKLIHICAEVWWMGEAAIKHISLHQPIFYVTSNSDI